jgi:hypothetical protein
MAAHPKSVAGVAGRTGIACAALLAAGCAGSGIGLDANGRPLSGGSVASTPLTADFNSIQDHVFTPICSVCHAGGSAPQGLRLDAVNSYALLVGVASTEVPAIERVRPGDPDNSYLIQKLEGHAAVGARMPFGGPPLSPDTIAAIRLWIADGAQRPVVAAASADPAMRVAAVVPNAGEILPAAPPQIAVTFSGDLDGTRIDGGLVQIERVTRLNGVDTVEVLPATLTLPAGNPRALVVTPVSTLPAGHYRVVVRSAAGDVITDIGGRALQGAAMTSAGDPMVTRFTVEASP